MWGARDEGSIPGLGRFPRGGNGNPLQYSCPGNPVDRVWQAIVHGVTKSQTWLNDFTFTFHFHALEKEIATHSGVLARRIPGTGKTGGVPCMGLHRVGHDWSDLASAAAAGETYKNRANCNSTAAFLDCLSLTKIHFSFLHIVSWIDNSFPSAWIIFHCLKAPQFINLVSYWY